MAATAVSQQMESLKGRLKNTWMAGDYDRFSRYMENGARDFYERLNVAPGSRLLDIGCGSGQLALIAARDGVDSTGVDIATNSIERATARAKAEVLCAKFLEGDAEALPFEEASFDAVTSLVGAMFAPRPELVAQEMLRVCVPGGTIAMVNWTPQGFIGQMFKAVAKFIAPSGMPSPVLWGDETTVRERFGSGLSDLSLVKRDYTFSYPFPPSDVVEFFRLYYGPTNKAFASLDATTSDSLRKDLDALWTSHNRGDEGSTIVLAEYLEVIGVRA